MKRNEVYKIWISIHVPRVEDDVEGEKVPVAIRISIHVPRVEDDRPILMWAQTARHFNPRPPCGGRPEFKKMKIDEDTISIHVPRVEDDERSP